MGKHPIVFGPGMKDALAKKLEQRGRNLSKDDWEQIVNELNAEFPGSSLDVAQIKQKVQDIRKQAKKEALAESSGMKPGKSDPAVETMKKMERDTPMYQGTPGKTSTSMFPAEEDVEMEEEERSLLVPKWGATTGPKKRDVAKKGGSSVGSSSPSAEDVRCKQMQALNAEMEKNEDVKQTCKEVRKAARAVQSAAATHQKVLETATPPSSENESDD